MADTKQTLTQLAKKVRLTCTFGAALDWDKQSDWQRRANGYRCIMRYQRRTYTFDFWMGSAHTSEPDVEGCLDCLLSDAQGGEQTFEEFCSEFGYDQDSRKAEEIHRSCEKTAKAMRRLLGEDFEAFLYADRN